jgi:pyruvate/2-oxoglutarate dehydrogenase complex dihydrolipoamide acyltransferase (E2) component
LLILLTLPRINEHMTVATIREIHAAEGEFLGPGAKILDLLVDLSSIAPHDCPPISLYRIAMRDKAWVRHLAVSRGDTVPVGTDLARFTTEPDEPLTGAPARAARITVAGIIDQTDWWSAEQP